MPQYQKRKRAAAEELFQQKLTEKNVAKQLKISCSTVSRWYTLFKEQGHLEPRKGRGRKRKTGHQEDKEIVKKLKQNRKHGSIQAAQELKRDNISVSLRTVQRRAGEWGAKYLKPTKKQLINKRQQKQRKLFAEKYKNQNFNRVVFVDEKKFVLHSSTKKQWFFKDEIPVKGIPKRTEKVNVFAGITSDFKSKLYITNNNIDQSTYRSMIHETVLPLLQRKFYQNDWYMYHDHAPAHQAKSVKEYLKKHQIKSILRPPRNADLNPLENVWSILQSNVESRNPKSKNSLERILREEWKKISQHKIRNIVESFSKRLEKVIENGGKDTGY